jgi:hypothetical protein
MALSSAALLATACIIDASTTRSDQGIPIDPNFQLNGLSSDFAQHFYNRFAAGVSAPPLTLNAPLPVDIQKRVDAHGLTFAALPGLLQRALVWDTGYVMGDHDTLATVHTSCNNSRQMAEIALQPARFASAGCTAQNCTTLQQNTQRSLYCTGDQIATVATCAISSDVKARFRASLWATGGNSNMTSLPVPHAIRHEWTDASKSYLLFAIHTAENETPYEECPTTATPASMIIPCVALMSAAANTFCRPKPGALVDAWLQQQKTGGSKKRTDNSTRIKDEMDALLESELSGNSSLSSDLTLQFYRLERAGSKVEQMKLTHGELPKQVQDRLKGSKMRFEQLNGFAQRALLWDAGFITGPSLRGKQLVKIYTRNGASMATIAVSLAEFDATGCTRLNCTDALGAQSYRSQFCKGEQMLSASSCASEDVAGENQNLSMWATGANMSASSSVLPEPNVVRHDWLDNSTNSSYLVFGIHTAAPANHPKWGSCGAETTQRAMIIPCDVYRPENASRQQWQDPAPGKLMNLWLQRVANELAENGDATEAGSTKGLHWAYIVAIVSGALLLLLAAVLIYRKCRKYEKESDMAAFEAFAEQYSERKL